MISQPKYQYILERRASLASLISSLDADIADCDRRKADLEEQKAQALVQLGIYNTDLRDPVDTYEEVHGLARSMRPFVDEVVERPSGRASLA
jgi:hypothetical protein